MAHVVIILLSGFLAWITTVSFALAGAWIIPIWIVYAILLYLGFFLFFSGDCDINLFD